MNAHGASPFIRTEEAAELLCLAPQTLAKWRIYGEGPPFLKLSGRVLYERDRVLSWATERRVAHTLQDPEKEAALRQLAKEPAPLTEEELLEKAMRCPSHAVYVLFNRDRIVYVGRSSRIFQRLGEHAESKAKRFDGVTLIPCNSREESAELEALYIRQFDPPLNVQQPSAGYAGDLLQEGMTQ